MKTRLDVLLVQRGFATAREKAKDLIKAGQVEIDNKKCKKPSQVFEEDCEIKITGETLKYVSRGGLKLEKAIKEFEINLNDKVCADIGASTGGFTDCMLLNGASKVYAVDVGHDQLHEKLCKDNRVINLEGTNVRQLSQKIINEQIDFISIDVSFISLKLVLPNLIDLLCDNGEIVALIKPQFEAGKSFVGKKGVVKSRKTHKMVLNNFIMLAGELNINIKDITFSPIKGPQGNIEYLAFLSKNYYTGYNKDIYAIISTAFTQLKDLYVEV